MPQKDTVILLTPPGPAAIAVIRLAGPGTAAFLAKYFSKPTAANRCVHGTLHDESGAELDDPVVVVSADGMIADLNVHGGAWVVQSVLNLAKRAGFEPAVSDASALDADDEIERDVQQSLPAARTELALRTLLAQPAAWATLMHNRKRDVLEAMLADRSLIHLLSPPTVAIVGAPNVGKSTLANHLFAQERSITADMPGTTRDWVGEIANIDGLAVTLVDTPGVRETADAIERTAIERSTTEIRRADLIVLVLDSRRALEPEQAFVLNAHPEALKVINKVDRPAAWDANQLAAIKTVARTGDGVDILRDAIRRHFGCLDVAISAARVWTPRQRVLISALFNAEFS